jgi:uncharacterized membrane protein
LTVRNPIEWSIAQFRVSRPLGAEQHGPARTGPEARRALAVRRIGAADLIAAIQAGFRDFGDNRTDVVFLCIVYPVVGLILARQASGSDLLALLFPLASGFALVGPLAGVGLYEMSRRREQGAKVGWLDTFGVLRSPSLGGIVMLGLTLTGLFLFWLLVAYAIYKLTLGPQPPASIAQFASDVFTTPPGWTMIGVGVALGFVFAVVTLAISVVSFPLLLDRDVGFEAAVRTSIRAVAANPGPMALWGLIVTGSLVIGSIPLFVGLIVILPVLGHSTWHLYRRVVPR